jgi:hypothetical protein
MCLPIHHVAALYYCMHTHHSCHKQEVCSCEHRRATAYASSKLKAVPQLHPVPKKLLQTPKVGTTFMPVMLMAHDLQTSTT